MGKESRLASVEKNMKEELITVKCNHRVRVDGKLYLPGAELAISKDNFDSLKGAVSPKADVNANSHDEGDALDVTNDDSGEATNEAAIVEAILSLSVEDKSLFSADGKPKVDVLTEKLGTKVSAKERDAAMGFIDAQAGADAEEHF